MPFEVDVSIIIVNYNTCDLTRNCIRSIFEQTKDIVFEVIVSDNGSTDGSVEMIKTEFPQVVLIENNANLGFGAANNRGLTVAKGKYVFYLNSDTVLLNNAVKIFFDYWESAKDKAQIGALGCNLTNENGIIIHSYGDFPQYKSEVLKLIKTNISIFINIILAIFRMPYPHSKKVDFKEFYSEVDYVTGADLFMLNTDLAKFDEKFFLYYEETDLQWQLQKSGLKRVIINGPKIIHLEGKSNNAKKESIYRYISFSAQQILLSRLIWFKKNKYSKIWFFMLAYFTISCLLHIPFLKKAKDTRRKIYKLLCLQN